MAFASSSMASTAEILTRVHTTRCSALPYLPPPRNKTPSSIKDLSRLDSSPLSWRRGISQLRIRATSSKETSTPVDTGELLSDLQEKWDAIETKSTVFLYGGGAIVVVWLSSILVGAINSVPLLPKIMELVGLGYTGWFVYRYLLCKSSRKELATDIEYLKKKIAGTE